MNDKTKEILVGVVKSGFSAIPFAGGVFNEICFDIRSRIVQQRLNNFTDSLLDYLKEMGLDIDEGLITSESFNDLYISILKRVTETSCKHKLNIFRDILTNNISKPYESNFRETFLDLVNKLDYIEIEILQMYKETGRFGSMDIAEGNVGSVSSVVRISYEKDIKQRIRENSPELSTIEIEGKYEFYICDLTSKSLLVDSKVIGNTYNDIAMKGLSMLYISDFGKEFLKFIRTGF